METLKEKARRTINENLKSPEDTLRLQSIPKRLQEELGKTFAKDIADAFWTIFWNQLPNYDVFN